MFTFTAPTATERLIIKSETTTELMHRYGLTEETARRIVEASRTVDHAYALAGLMK